MRPILIVVACTLALAACGKKDEAAGDVAPTTTAPSAADADQFIAGINADLRRMLPQVNAAQWLQATYITDDSQMIASRANEEYLGWQAGKVQEAKKFNDTAGMSADTARALMLLKNVSAPASGAAATTTVSTSTRSRRSSTTRSSRRRRVRRRGRAGRKRHGRSARTTSALSS
jgi:hypothetical protein